MDTVSPVTRSRIMSAIGQRDTAPELEARRALHKAGLRYRLHDKRLPGTPDIVFPARRVALFVHGCFWHQHDCRPRKVRTRADYWQAKFDKNAGRHARACEQLERQGWRVFVCWECETRQPSKLGAIVRAIAKSPRVS